MYEKSTHQKIFFLLGLIACAWFNISIAQTTQPSPFASEVDLIWEAVDSYTPPFYKGKALLPPQGSVRVFAFTPEEWGNPNALVYRWKVDGTVLGSRSGVGQNSLQLEGTLFGSEPVVVVDVTNTSGDNMGSGAIRIPFTQPEISLYRETPLGGIDFDFKMNGAETTITNDVSLEAYPYFFTTTHRNDARLTYRWYMNNRALENIFGPSVTLQPTDSSGITNVAVRTEHVHNILQRDDLHLTLTSE